MIIDTELSRGDLIVHGPTLLTADDAAAVSGGIMVDIPFTLYAGVTIAGAVTPIQSTLGTGAGGVMGTAAFAAGWVATGLLESWAASRTNTRKSS